MIDYDEIREIHRKSDRIKTNAGVTPDNSSFVYESNSQFVKKGVSYHIHYTLDFEEYYMTGRTHNKFSRLIRPIDPEMISDYSNYVKLNNGEVTRLYQKPVPSRPLPKDYLRGFFYRYFAKKVNDPETPVIEVNTNFKTPAYRVEKIKWIISGNPNAVFYQNRLTSDVLLTMFDGSKQILTNYTEYLVMPELGEDEQVMKSLGVLNVPRDKDGNKVFNK